MHRAHRLYRTRHRSKMADPDPQEVKDEAEEAKNVGEVKH